MTTKKFMKLVEGFELSEIINIWSKSGRHIAIGIDNKHTRAKYCIVVATHAGWASFYYNDVYEAKMAFYSRIVDMSNNSQYYMNQNL